MEILDAFFSLPCLIGILPDNFLRHWLLLVHSLALLLSESISETDLVNADLMLKKFVLFVEVLYGKHHMTFNIHQLLHTVTTVRNWGPCGPTQPLYLNRTMVLY